MDILLGQGYAKPKPPENSNSERFKTLPGLRQLRRLDLNGTKVTDAGLVHLQGLSQLGFLWLDNTKVTDAGLVHLRELSQLEYLVVSNTRVTAQGVKKLQQALPNCRIER